jgi:hypothetical protein
MSWLPQETIQHKGFECLFGFQRRGFSVRNTVLETPKKHAGGRPEGRTGKTRALYLSFEALAVIDALTESRGRGAGARFVDDLVRALQEIARRELPGGSDS